MVATATPAPSTGALIGVEGGNVDVPSGKYAGRKVNDLATDEAKDLLGKLPAGNRWHTLVGALVKAREAVASDPSLAEAQDAFDLTATK
jgi:hypothetical protein